MKSNTIEFWFAILIIWCGVLSFCLYKSVKTNSRLEQEIKDLHEYSIKTLFLENYHRKLDIEKLKDNNETYMLIKQLQLAVSDLQDYSLSLSAQILSIRIEPFISEEKSQSIIDSITYIPIEKPKEVEKNGGEIQNESKRTGGSVKKCTTQTKQSSPKQVYRIPRKRFVIFRRIRKVQTCCRLLK